MVVRFHPARQAAAAFVLNCLAMQSAHAADDYLQKMTDYLAGNSVGRKPQQRDPDIFKNLQKVEEAAGSREGPNIINGAVLKNAVPILTEVMKDRNTYETMAGANGADLVAAGEAREQQHFKTIATVEAWKKQNNSEGIDKDILSATLNRMGQYAGELSQQTKTLAKKTGRAITSAQKVLDSRPDVEISKVAVEAPRAAQKPACGTMGWYNQQGSSDCASAEPQEPETTASQTGWRQTSFTANYINPPPVSEGCFELPKTIEAYTKLEAQEFTSSMGCTITKLALINTSNSVFTYTCQQNSQSKTSGSYEIYMTDTKIRTIRRELSTYLGETFEEEASYEKCDLPPGAGTLTDSAGGPAVKQ